jgi:hypothetical protein
LYRKAERKVVVSSGPVTVDVNALWAQMTSGPAAEPNGTEDKTTAQQPKNNGTDTIPAEADEGDKPIAPTDDEPSAMIRIKRTYNFAGKVHTEEKLVARDSAEAKLHFSTLDHSSSATDLNPDQTTSPQPPRRMPRKAFRSVFEPVLADASVQRGDLNLGVVAVRMRANGERDNKAKKLNTVEKSRMDWAGFVDKEGIKDELALAGKAKGNFAGRQEFLARSEARREEDARKARLAGKV